MWGMKGFSNPLLINSLHFCVKRVAGMDFDDKASQVSGTTCGSPYTIRSPQLFESLKQLYGEVSSAEKLTDDRKDNIYSPTIPQVSFLLGEKTEIEKQGEMFRKRKRTDSDDGSDSTSCHSVSILGNRQNTQATHSKVIKSIIPQTEKLDKHYGYDDGGKIHTQIESVSNTGTLKQLTNKCTQHVESVDSGKTQLKVDSEDSDETQLCDSGRPKNSFTYESQTALSVSFNEIEHFQQRCLTPTPTSQTLPSGSQGQREVIMSGVSETDKCSPSVEGNKGKQTIPFSVSTATTGNISEDMCELQDLISQESGANKQDKIFSKTQKIQITIETELNCKDFPAERIQKISAWLKTLQSNLKLVNDRQQEEKLKLLKDFKDKNKVKIEKKMVKDKLENLRNRQKTLLLLFRKQASLDGMVKDALSKSSVSRVDSLKSGTSHYLGPSNSRECDSGIRNEVTTSVVNTFTQQSLPSSGSSSTLLKGHCYTIQPRDENEKSYSGQSEAVKEVTPDHTKQHLLKDCKQTIYHNSIPNFLNALKVKRYGSTKALEGNTKDVEDTGLDPDISPERLSGSSRGNTSVEKLSGSSGRNSNKKSIGGSAQEDPIKEKLSGSSVGELRREVIPGPTGEVSQKEQLSGINEGSTHLGKLFEKSIQEHSGKEQIPISSSEISLVSLLTGSSRKQSQRGRVLVPTLKSMKMGKSQGMASKNSYRREFPGAVEKGTKKRSLPGMNTDGQNRSEQSSTLDKSNESELFELGGRNVQKDLLSGSKIKKSKIQSSGLVDMATGSSHISGNNSFETNLLDRGSNKQQTNTFAGQNINWTQVQFPVFNLEDINKRKPPGGADNKSIQNQPNELIRKMMPSTEPKKKMTDKGKISGSVGVSDNKIIQLPGYTTVSRNNMDLPGSRAGDKGRALMSQCITSREEEGQDYRKITNQTFKSPLVVGQTCEKDIQNISPSTACSTDVFPVKSSELDRRMQLKRLSSQQLEQEVTLSNQLKQLSSQQLEQEVTFSNQLKQLSSQQLEQEVTLSNQESGDKLQLTAESGMDEVTPLVHSSQLDQCQLERTEVQGRWGGLKFPSLTSMMEAKVLYPGHNVLTVVTETKTFTASLTNSGRIRTLGGELLKTPVKWLSAVLGEDCVKKSRAYREVLYDGVPLQSYVDGSAKYTNGIRSTGQDNALAVSQSSDHTCLSMKSTLNNMADMLYNCNIRLISDEEVLNTQNFPENYWSEDIHNVILPGCVWEQLDCWDVVGTITT